MWVIYLYGVFLLAWHEATKRFNNMIAKTWAYIKKTIEGMTAADILLLDLLLLMCIQTYLDATLPPGQVFGLSFITATTGVPVWVLFALSGVVMVYLSGKRRPRATVIGFLPILIYASFLFWGTVTGAITSVGWLAVEYRSIFVLAAVVLIVSRYRYEALARESAKQAYIVRQQQNALQVYEMKLKAIEETEKRLEAEITKLVAGLTDAKQLD